MLLTALVFVAFGLSVGSFLNVFVLRKGVASLSGRSKCPSCGHIIAWYDLIPVFSWFILRARCRNCGSRISMQYPLVEASTGIIFGLVAGVPFFGLAYKLLYCLIFALLICKYIWRERGIDK
jgi:leader peptidase (prepilin peptidase)/N-methyltransferase